MNHTNLSYVGISDAERLRGSEPSDADLRADALADEVEAETAAVIEEWMRDPHRVGENGMCLTDDEYEAIDRAVAAGDAEATLRAHQTALRRRMRGDAQKEAVRRVAARNAQAERDAAHERADALMALRGAA